MRLWRITTARWALDKLCAGARAEGGRWNPVGQAALYAGTNIEICAFEKFVHTAGIDHPPLKLVAIDVPDNPKFIFRPAVADLPDDWASLPVSSSSQEFGGRWLTEGKQLMMMVPSAIVPEATNAVINPNHPEYKNVQLSIVRNFTFDSRMFR
jgi:RES domain-containing protein